MKKILFSLVAMAMLFAFTSCDTEQTAAKSFLKCCTNKQYSEAKGYIDEITKDFDTYSSNDKSDIMEGLEILVSYSKDPELGDAYVTLYNKVKDDSNVKIDKDAANFCEWVENGFTTGCDFTDATTEDVPQDSTQTDDFTSDDPTVPNSNVPISNETTTSNSSIGNK